MRKNKDRRKEERKNVFSLCSFFNCKRKKEPTTTSVCPPSSITCLKSPKPRLCLKKRGLFSPCTTDVSSRSAFVVVVVVVFFLQAEAITLRIKPCLSSSSSYLLTLTSSSNQTKPLHPKKNPETLPSLLVSAAPF